MAPVADAVACMERLERNPGVDVLFLSDVSPITIAFQVCPASLSRLLSAAKPTLRKQKEKINTKIMRFFILTARPLNFIRSRHSSVD